MRALRDDAAVVQHEDAVRMAHRRGALRHDEHRQVRQRGDRLPEPRVGRIVERRGAVVQDQDVRPAHQRARDGQALALPAGEVAPALLDEKRQPARLLLHKIAGLRQLERRVVLAVLDRKWREHLYEMDYLKDGIGLRGMGQRDPLVEYQREGYQMYNSMIEAIKEETIQLLFHVDIERVAMTEDEETESDEDEAVNAAEAVMGLDGEAAATGESAPAEPETDDEAEKTTIDELADEQKNEKGIVGMQPISHAEGKVPANKRPKSEELHSPWADGRTFPGTGKNAQCPCGSGRKYKMCHGQNEQ